MKTLRRSQDDARTPKASRLRKGIAFAAAGAVFATGLTVLASPAQAAPRFSFSFEKHKNGAGKIRVLNNGAIAGVVAWAADPDSYPAWSSTGDTLYVRDQYSDGYAIEGSVVHANGKPSYYRSASTSGHKADYSVRKTGNLAEGRKLQLRACVLQGAKVIQCSPYYAVHA